MTIGGGGIASNLAKSAFGGLLVDQLHPQYQGSFEYTVGNTDLNKNTLVNGGTITQADGMALVGTSTTTASSALFESKQHAKYRPGLGGVSRFTTIFDTPVVGTEQFMGLGDETGSSEAFKNGYILGYDISGNLGFHRFRNDVKFSIPASTWDDPLDGSGASGITIVPTNLNIFYIQFQYLGGGPQFIWYENPNGQIFIVHTAKYANLNTEPSVHNPNFHHVMWVDNKATTANLILKSSSYAYFVEGKTSLIELHQPENSSGSKTLPVLANVEGAIFTIRNRSTYASKTNFIDAQLLSFGGSIDTNSANNLATIRVVKNATLGGTPSYSNINTNNSIMEIDTSGTTVTGGTELDSIELSGKNDRDKSKFSSDRIILNPGETITVAGVSSGDATMKGNVVWRELF